MRGRPVLAPVVVSSMTGTGYTELTRPPVRRSSGGSSRGAICFMYQSPTGVRANFSNVRSYTLILRRCWGAMTDYLASPDALSTCKSASTAAVNP